MAAKDRNKMFSLRSFAAILTFRFQIPHSLANVAPTLMPKPHAYKFCFGPWNLSEGQDPYGPPTRPAQTFDWKLDQLKKLGFDAMMFHDDDAVPDIDGKSSAQLSRETK